MMFCTNGYVPLGIKILLMWISWELVTFKQEYGTEHYVQVVTNRQHRAALSQFRCGVLPLKVETVRFQDIPVEDRVCTMCEENVIETESHVLLYCSKYNQLR